MKNVIILDKDNGVRDSLSTSLAMFDVGTVCYDDIESFNVETNKSVKVLLIDPLEYGGTQTVSYLRNEYPQMIMFVLSEKTGEMEKVKMLNAGADDYIVKPFSALETVARINAAIRHFPSMEKLKVGNLVLNSENYTVKLGEKQLTLNHKEYSLLKYLMERHGKVVTRDELLVAVWGFDLGETRTIDNHIARLRKLGIDGIETIFGIGYMLK